MINVLNLEFHGEVMTLVVTFEPKHVTRHCCQAQVELAESSPLPPDRGPAGMGWREAIPIGPLGVGNALGAFGGLFSEFGWPDLSSKFATFQDFRLVVSKKIGGG